MKSITPVENALLRAGMIRVGDNEWVRPDNVAVQESIAEFTRQRPRYKPTPSNRDAILRVIAAGGWTLTTQSLLNAYDALTAENKLELQDVPIAARIISLADAPQAHVSRVDFESGAITETEPTPAFSSANARHARNRAQIQTERERQVAAKMGRSGR